MNSDERNRLIEAWIAFSDSSSNIKLDKRNENYWVFEEMYELIHKDSGLDWQIVFDAKRTTAEKYKARQFLILGFP